MSATRSPRLRALALVAPLALAAPSLSCGGRARTTPPLTGLAETPAARLLGSPAPDFTLPAVAGPSVSLASLRGRTVVLEWFNPLCPFVVRAHTRGSLVDAAQRHAQSDVAWLAINSAALGRQGHALEENTAGIARFGLSHPVLRDESGEVGHAYGATNTPHLFVISPAGVVVYAGAIDNSPDGERGAPTGGTLVNYVDEALADLAAGRPVRTPLTRPYGCSVKYAP